MPILEAVLFFLAGLLGHMLDPVALMFCALIAIYSAEIPGPELRFAVVFVAAVALAIIYAAALTQLAAMDGQRRPPASDLFLIFLAAMADIAALQWALLRWRASKAAPPPK